MSRKGRPVAGSEPRHRNKMLTFWVTETEKAALERRAEAAGFGLSEWLRRLALGDAIETDGRRKAPEPE